MYVVVLTSMIHTSTVVGYVDSYLILSILIWYIQRSVNDKRAFLLTMHMQVCFVYVFSKCNHYIKRTYTLSSYYMDFYIISVIILLIPRNELRRFMLRASYLGMTGGDYQFLFTDTQVRTGSLTSQLCILKFQTKEKHQDQLVHTPT